MSFIAPMRPFGSLKTILRSIRAEVPRRQFATTDVKPPRIKDFHPGNIYRQHRQQEASCRAIKTYPSTTKSAKSICPDPIAALMAAQLPVLDPRNQRTRLFSKQNRERARAGDVLLVRTKTGDPFSGVCINVRHAGIDTAILLRGQLSRTGVEAWFKIYSPNIEGIEVVQRAQRRIRRAKLYYMRDARHDRGSVENVTRQYLRTKSSLRGSSGSSGGGSRKR